MTPLEAATLLRTTPSAIRDLRLALGLTRTEMSHSLSLNRETAGRWESGASVPTGMSLSALVALQQAVQEAPQDAGAVGALLCREGLGRLLYKALSGAYTPIPQRW